MEGATTYSCLSFYCPFCVEITLWSNKGNQSKCQQCTTLGTNYMDTCSRCQKDSTFCLSEFAVCLMRWRLQVGRPVVCQTMPSMPTINWMEKLSWYWNMHLVLVCTTYSKETAVSGLLRGLSPIPGGEWQLDLWGVCDSKCDSNKLAEEKDDWGKLQLLLHHLQGGHLMAKAVAQDVIVRIVWDGWN